MVGFFVGLAVCLSEGEEEEEKPDVCGHRNAEGMSNAPPDKCLFFPSL